MLINNFVYVNEYLKNVCHRGKLKCHFKRLGHSAGHCFTFNFV